MRIAQALSSAQVGPTSTAISKRARIWRHPEVPFWLCVGDVASRRRAYEPAAPFYWIKGNNEDFDGSACRGLPAGPPLHPERRLTVIAGRSACRGPRRHVSRQHGTTRRRAAADPRTGTGKATEPDKRRHFVREEVEACKRDARRGHPPDARGAAAVRAARPGPRTRRREAADQRGARRRCSRGCTSSAPSPLHRDGVRACRRSASICVSSSYLLIDADTWNTMQSHSHMVRTHFSRTAIGACSSATARWGRCSTRRAFSSTAVSTS